MTSIRTSEHVHCGALSALLAHDGRPKSHVARDLGMSAGNLRDYETGVRSGATQATRDRLAWGLGVHPLALTCWCDRPDDVCRSVHEEI